MQAARRKGATEALMLNQAGQLCECSQTNFFLVLDGDLVTPPLDAGLLPGITRAFVLSLAADVGVPARETACTVADLARASEAFLTGTTREITPVVTVDGRPIGTGRPGPITLKLLEAFRARVRVVTA
jgi:branched-chain amino acid aminotransferase